MKLVDFDFELPPELIAQYPQKPRSASRLLNFSRQTNEIQHQEIRNLPDILSPGDLLVFNDTKVIPARLYGHKITGGKVEILIERLLGEKRALAHIKASKALKTGQRIGVERGVWFEVLARHQELFEIILLGEIDLLTLLHQVGHIPLPLYIKRDDVVEDRENYQTIFARCEGAIAAPTAGLHFDEPLLQTLKEKGIQQTFITLHTGAGTFKPVRVDNIIDHEMHSEIFTVSAETCRLIKETKARGNQVIAVGTTTVRTLETLAKKGELEPYQGETKIFIYPGFDFQVIDGMITNFHLPQSTLLMLVAAFAGHKEILRIYQEAIQQRYRFYSYGDAMLIR